MFYMRNSRAINNMGTSPFNQYFYTFIDDASITKVIYAAFFLRALSLSLFLHLFSPPPSK